MHESSFIQEGPEFRDPFENELLHTYLKRFLSDNEYRVIARDLKQFSHRLISEVEPLARTAESNPPTHNPYSPWGERVDEIIVDQSWRDLEKIASEENIVGIGYKREQKENSRLFQMAKLFLFHPSSAYFSCPLAMTDGAAKLIEEHGDDELKKHAFPHLISNNPEIFWTSGQWMTEKAGGSDVGLSETKAYQKGDHYELHGVKWFTSATTSQMAMTLARVVDENGKSIEGSKGLALFYLELRDANKKLNNIEICRLKDKLGTKALPTAELKLMGTKAKMIGDIGEGVKKISSLFNITRIYNSCCATGAYYRLLDLALDYAKKRYAFKKHIIEHPLHQKLLAKQIRQYQSCFHLTFYLSRLLGEEEYNQNEQSSKVLRLLTPITKLYTAKMNMLGSSELIETFGGAGFIEDTGLPKWLRDAQVLTIWEGTTNVLALDALRAISKDGVFTPYCTEMKNKLKNCHQAGFENTYQLLDGKFKKIINLTHTLFQDPNLLELNADNLAFTLAKLTSSILMLEHATVYSEIKSFKIHAEEFINDPWPNFTLNPINFEELM